MIKIFDFYRKLNFDSNKHTKIIISGSYQSHGFIQIESECSISAIKKLLSVTTVVITIIIAHVFTNVYRFTEKEI